MYETDMIYRLCLMAGFLSASFLALLIALCVSALRRLCHKAKKELEEMMCELDKTEEISHDAKDT